MSKWVASPITFMKFGFLDELPANLLKSRLGLLPESILWNNCSGTICNVPSKKLLWYNLFIYSATLQKANPSTVVFVRFLQRFSKQLFFRTPVSCFFKYHLKQAWKIDRKMDWNFYYPLFWVYLRIYLEICNRIWFSWNITLLFIDDSQNFPLKQSLWDCILK